VDSRLRGNDKGSVAAAPESIPAKAGIHAQEMLLASFQAFSQYEVNIHE